MRVLLDSQASVKDFRVVRASAIITMSTQIAASRMSESIP
jgi:hypothetical protein